MSEFFKLTPLWFEKQLSLLNDQSERTTDSESPVLLTEGLIKSWASYLYGNLAMIEELDLQRVITEWVTSHAQRNSSWPNMSSRAAIENLARHIVEGNASL